MIFKETKDLEWKKSDKSERNLLTSNVDGVHGEEDVENIDEVGAVDSE